MFGSLGNMQDFTMAEIWQVAKKHGKSGFVQNCFLSVMLTLKVHYVGFN